MGGALCLGMMIILGFLFTLAYNGLMMFCPKPIQVVTTENGDRPTGAAVNYLVLPLMI